MNNLRSGESTVTVKSTWTALEKVLMISQIGQRQSASPFCSSDSLPVAVLVLPEARRNCTLFCVVVLQTVFVFALCDILVGL